MQPKGQPLLPCHFLLLHLFVGMSVKSESEPSVISRLIGASINSKVKWPVLTLVNLFRRVIFPY
ncbi:hypothetical protein AYI72_16065 [Shewanella algae]|uniref:hypothetical protein n=1 Tax=Shewanella algae TaxID=38313 RepID=UPI001D8E6B7C|nr:hypothetical protein AYI72_16065 [Shewanella algae]